MPGKEKYEQAVQAVKAGTATREQISLAKRIGSQAGGGLPSQAREALKGK